MAKAKSKLQKAKEIASRVKKPNRKKSSVDRYTKQGQNAPQSKVWTEPSDEGVSAKPIGWRFTTEGAKRLKISNAKAKPSREQIEKYSGKTFTKGGEEHRYIYQESRVDKSDKSVKAKFKKGGQTAPQSQSYKRSADKKVEAKPVGYRYKGNNYNKPSDAVIKREMKKPREDRRIYFETRKDKSDFDFYDKLKKGGAIESIKNKLEIANKLISDGKTMKDIDEGKEVKYMPLKLKGNNNDLIIEIKVKENGRWVNEHKYKVTEWDEGYGEETRLEALNRIIKELKTSKVELFADGGMMAKGGYLYIKEEDIDKFDKWSDENDYSSKEIKWVNSDKDGYYKFKVSDKSFIESIINSFPKAMKMADGGMMAKGGMAKFKKGLSTFASKTKELAKKGVEKTKEGYGKAKKYTKDKIHDQKKKIALEVIDDTKDKYNDNKSKMILRASEELVEDKYKKGGEVLYLESDGTSQRLVKDKSKATPMWIMDAEYYVKSQNKNASIEKIDKSLPDRVGRNYIVVTPNYLSLKKKMIKSGMMADGGETEKKYYLIEWYKTLRDYEIEIPSDRLVTDSLEQAKKTASYLSISPYIKLPYYKIFDDTTKEVIYSRKPSYADGGMMAKGVHWDKDEDGYRTELGTFKINIYPSTQKGYWNVYVNENKKSIGNEYDVYGIDNAKDKAYDIISNIYKMADGGVTFDEKVSAISKALLKRKKVSPSVQKDYGKTYSKKEAIESAKRIAGAMRKKEKMAKGGYVIRTRDKSIADDVLKYADLQEIASSYRKVGNYYSIKLDSKLEPKDSMTKKFKDAVYWQLANYKKKS